MARRKLIAEKKSSDRDYESDFADGNKRVDKAIAVRQAAERKLWLARVAESEALSAVQTSSIVHRQAVDRLEEQLRESSNPEIAEFRSWCLDEIAKARKAFSFEESATLANPLTGKRARSVRSNRVSVAERIDALRMAMDLVESWRTELDDQSVVPEKIAELKKALPEIDMLLK